MQIKRTVKGKEKILNLPNFAPDATRAGVKGLPSEYLANTGTEAVVVNTYHLMLKPGAQTIAKAGGIHKFMSWDGFAISDSGGYQVFSLVHKDKSLGRVEKDGVKFKNVYNGSWEFLSPERSIEIQMDLGTDIMVLLDDVRPNNSDKETMKRSIDTTLSWAKIQKKKFLQEAETRGFDEKSRPKLTAVIQGGVFDDLRKYCMEGLLALEDDKFKFDGFGFGGSHINEEGELMKDALEFTASLIPPGRYAFALGIGRPSDIAFAKSVGWNLFDCTVPTREARHGKVFYAEGDKLRHFNIKNSKFKDDFTPLFTDCYCGCSEYTKAYLHHLFSVQDPGVFTILQKHNLTIYTKFVKGR